MEKTQPFNLTTDDIAWVSRKLNAHYAMIKKTTELTDEERQSEINYLMNRALRFGLLELVDRMGYLIIEIPFSQDREARLIIPKNYTKNDLDIIRARLNAHIAQKELIHDESNKPI